MTEEDMVNYQIIDTSKLQLRSLEAFMNALGYRIPMWCFHDRINFYSIAPENRHRSTISFNTAVRMHNGGLLDWHGARFRDPFAMDTYKMKVAQASKIVYHAKLQYCKKTKRIICQDHNVAFVDPAYEQLFLGK